MQPIEELLEELDDEDLELQLSAIKAEQRRRKEEKKWPQSTTFYLHGCKDSNWETAKDLKLPDEDAQKTFSYCGYEVEFTLVVEKDGTSVATHVDGVKLERPIKMS